MKIYLSGNQGGRYITPCVFPETVNKRGANHILYTRNDYKTVFTIPDKVFKARYPYNRSLRYYKTISGESYDLAKLASSAKVIYSP